MESELKFSSAQLSLLVHATEDKDKILGAIVNAFSIPGNSFSESAIEGHFGNPILLLTSNIQGGPGNDLAVSLMKMLNSSDRALLSSSIGDYHDEKGNLYLRIDKQKLCQGKISLSENDPVRLKFKPVRRYHSLSDTERYRRFLSFTAE